MSNEENISQPPEDLHQPITSQEFARYAKEKKLNPGCHVCGHQVWIVMGSRKGMDWSLVATSRQVGLQFPAPTFPLVTLVCENCYNVRNHALIPVRDWLNSNKDE